MRPIVSLLLLLITPGLAQERSAHNITRLLNEGKAVFGSMVQDKSEAGGAALAMDARVDFAFYSMEQGPFDVDTLGRFMAGIRKQPGKSVLVRIPPIGSDRQAAQNRVSQLLAAGVDGIVFPHIQNREEAEFAVSLLKSGKRGVWPLDRSAQSVMGYFMIEDAIAVKNVRDIAATPGIGILSGGQGSLSQAFNGNAAEVEAALVSILDACKATRTTCAKLVSESDVAQRVAQGFRVFLANGRALDTGRQLAGR